MKHPYDIREDCCADERAPCTYHEGWLAAAEATADAATEAEMRLAHLRDEVAAVLAGPYVGFYRLSVALKATETPLRTDSRHATAEDDSRPPTPTQGA